MKIFKNFLCLVFLIAAVTTNLSFKQINSNAINQITTKAETVQKDSYYFFLVATEFIPSTGKNKFYVSEVLYFKGYADWDKNLDYIYYGIVKEKYNSFLIDKFKVNKVNINREGSKRSSVPYFETKDIAQTALTKYVKDLKNFGNEIITTDFNFDCNEIK